MRSKNDTDMEPYKRRWDYSLEETNRGSMLL